MTENNYKKSLYVDVSTFADLTGKGSVMTALLSDILSAFIIPFNRSLIIHIEKTNGRATIYRLDYKTWDKTYKLLVEGEVQHMLINDNEERVPYDPDIAISITCDYAKEFPGWPIPAIANNMSFSLSERLYNGIIPPNVQDKAKDFLKRMFTELNGVSGFITYETKSAHFSPGVSSIERLLEMDYVMNSYNYSKIARGYHWGNILSEGHIEQLGGIDAVFSSSPCNKVEKLEFDGRKALYMQLTPDINDYPDEKLRELKKYLKPILPKENMEKIVQADPEGILRRCFRLVFD